MLEPDELNRLDGTLLPSLERHHLRLMAHGLRTLQAIAGQRQGRAPERDAIRSWVERQPAIADDAGFAAAFTDQLEHMAGQLSAIAADHRCEPLGLDLEALIDWAQRNADQRIGRAACDHRSTAPDGAFP